MDMGTVESEFDKQEDGSYFVRLVDLSSGGWLEYETTRSVHLEDWQ